MLVNAVRTIAANRREQKFFGSFFKKELLPSCTLAFASLRFAASL